MQELSLRSYWIIGVPREEQCLTVTDNPKRGKNMFVLGLLAWVYDRDMEKVKGQIAQQFRKKSEEVYKRNVELMELCARWAEENLDFGIDVTAVPSDRPMVVMNGNQALGMGAMAAGLDLCAMYPITPATSVSHYLGDVFESVGGIVHRRRTRSRPSARRSAPPTRGRSRSTRRTSPILAPPFANRSS